MAQRRAYDGTMPLPEGLRDLAASLFAQGLTRAEAARRLGVSRATATRWYRVWKNGGRGGLLMGKRRGRPPRLETRALAAVDRALFRSPRELGFDLDRWSLAAVAALIERSTGARYHRRHVGRLLRRAGWVLPPVGATHDRAFRSRPLRDPDGNPIALLERRRPRT